MNWLKGKQFSTYQLLPYQFPQPAENNHFDPYGPTIIETDPMGIYNQIIERIIASSYYQIIQKSAIAEHSTRYNLMQNRSKMLMISSRIATRYQCRA